MGERRRDALPGSACHRRRAPGQPPGCTLGLQHDHCDPRHHAERVEERELRLGLARSSLCSGADGAGRAAALDFTRALRDDLAALCERAGRQLVARVQLHSAPTRLAQEDAFKSSLAELATWDWCGARLVIEHCDKFVPEQNPEKGFLSLESEIGIASEVGIGIHLNWGRSAVEGRSANTAYEHVLEAGKRGVLDGIIFSGAGPEETQYGYSWIDGHLPAQADEPTSLMDEAEIARCAQAAIEGGAKYLGAKVCVPKDASLEQRLAMLTNIYRACGLGD